MSLEAVDVKLLSAEDLPLLDRVDPGVFDFPVQRTLAEQYLATSGNLLAVATLSGVVVGMASAIAYVHPDKPLQLFINEIGVSERVQREGVGKRLMSALLEHGSLMGCTEAWVATEADNTAARTLYSKLDGVEDKERAVVYTGQLNRSNSGARNRDA